MSFIWVWVGAVWLETRSAVIVLNHSFSVQLTQLLFHTWFGKLSDMHCTSSLFKLIELKDFVNPFHWAEDKTNVFSWRAFSWYVIFFFFFHESDLMKWTLNVYSMIHWNFILYFCMCFFFLTFFNYIKKRLCYGLCYCKYMEYCSLTFSFWI